MKLIRLIILSFCFLFISCVSVIETDGLLECDTDKYPVNAGNTSNLDLFNAAKTGYIAGVRLALNNHANINVSDRLGQSALMWACWNGSSNIIDYMLNFDSEQRNKKKKIKYLDYKAESKEKYNPLFCLIMSNSIQTEKAKSCMKLLVEKSELYEKRPVLLTKEDAYNENILHKAIRSGNSEYLDFFLKELQKRKILDTFLEKRNKDSETPLILAVKQQEPEMIEILIKNGADISATYKLSDGEEKSLSILAFNEGNGNFQTFLKVMQARLSKHDSNSKGDAKLNREDTKLRKKLEQYKANTDYWSVYNKFIDLSVTKPEDLDVDTYKTKENKFFKIIQRYEVSESDIKQIKEMLKESPYLLESRYFYEQNNEYKTALQISIEKGNLDLFELILKYTNPYKIQPVSSGYSDYLICAIINNQPEMVEYLLSYRKKTSEQMIERLMSSNHHFDSDLVEMTSSETTGIPLVQFLRTEDLCNYSNLLDEVLAYYRPAYHNNPNYAGQVYQEVIDNHDENLLLLLYKFSNDGEDFYNVKMIKNSKGVNSPVESVLIDKNYVNALRQFYENSESDIDRLSKRLYSSFADGSSLIDKIKKWNHGEAFIELFKTMGLYEEESNTAEND